MTRYLNQKTVLSVFLCCVILGALSLAPATFSLKENLVHQIWLATSPSADATYARASRHFDAKNVRSYDIEHAEELFLKVLAMDPSRPLVRHQLARIEFLRGNFSAALRLINEEIALEGGPLSPSSYYVKGLIDGFKGDYAAAAEDYEMYLRTDPKNWAAINDYAWVLLKANRQRDALIAVDWGLMYWPDNPWLHNSRAIALFEMGRFEDAQEAASAASRAVVSVTEAGWLEAYPGNDPLIAPQGIAAFQKAVNENMHSIELAIKTHQKSVQ